MEKPKIEGRGALVGLAIAGVVIAGGFAIFLHLRSASKSEVTGTLTIDATPFAPRFCRSGDVEGDGPRDHPRFHGVDLLTSGGAARSVRVLEDPATSTSVLVIEPGEAPRPVDRAHCERFEVELRPTGELIMEVWGFEGSIDIDCPGVRGQVHFGRCYSGR